MFSNKELKIDGIAIALRCLKFKLYAKLFKQNHFHFPEYLF